MIGEHQGIGLMHGSALVVYAEKLLETSRFDLVQDTIDTQTLVA